MDLILGYEVFKNNEEFVTWQKENGNFDINQVSPIPLEVQGDISESEKSFGCTPNFGVFVLYAYNPDSKEVR